MSDNEKYIKNTNNVALSRILRIFLIGVCFFVAIGSLYFNNLENQSKDLYQNYIHKNTKKYSIEKAKIYFSNYAAHKTVSSQDPANISCLVKYKTAKGVYYSRIRSFKEMGIGEYGTTVCSVMKEILNDKEFKLIVSKDDPKVFFDEYEIKSKNVVNKTDIISIFMWVVTGFFISVLISIEVVSITKKKSIVLLVFPLAALFVFIVRIVAIWIGFDFFKSIFSFIF